MPTRRSTAEAFQILMSHTFGDAGSPYLVGVVSFNNLKLNKFKMSFNAIFNLFFVSVQISEAVKASIRNGSALVAAVVLSNVESLAITSGGGATSEVISYLVKYLES